MIIRLKIGMRFGKNVSIWKKYFQRHWKKRLDCAETPTNFSQTWNQKETKLWTTENGLYKLGHPCYQKKRKTKW